MIASRKLVGSGLAWAGLAALLWLVPPLVDPSLYGRRGGDFWFALLVFDDTHDLVLRVILLAMALAGWLVFSSLHSNEPGRLRTLSTLSDEAILVVTPEGTVSYAGPTATHVFGREASTLVGHPVTDLVVPGEIALLERALGQAVDRGPTPAEVPRLHVVRPDGADRLVQGRAVSLPKDPDIHGIVLSLHDITRRSRDRHDHDRLAQVIDISDDAIIHHDTDGIITAWNRGATAMFGWSASEALGQSVDMLTPSARPGQQTEITRELTHHKRVHDRQRTCVRKDGRLLPVSINAHAMTDADGAITGVTLVVRDVSRTVAAERERTELARLPEEAPIPILRVDADGTVLYANRSGRSLLEQLHRSVGQVLPGQWLVLALRTMARQEVSTSEIPCGQRVYNLTFTPVAEHNYLNIYGIDITERHRAEIELRDSEEKYRQLFDNMFSAFALCEMIFDDDDRPVDFRFLKINPAFLRQVSGGDPTGKTASEFLPGIEPVWIETCGQVVTSGRARHIENYMVQTGSWWNAWAFPLGTKQFGIVFTDISQRKRTEAEREIVGGVSQMFAANRPLEQIGVETARMISQLYAMELVQLSGLAESGELRPMGTWRTDADRLARTPDNTLPAHVLEVEHSVLCDDLDGGALPGLSAYREAGYRALLALPMTVGTTPTGALVMATRAPLHPGQLTQIRDSIGSVAMHFAQEQVRRRDRLKLERATSALSHKNQELESLIYVASHDLRSPLVNVDGFARELKLSMEELLELVASVELSDEKAKTLDRLVHHDIPISLKYIEAGTRRMDQLLGGLLKLSRVGRAELDMQPIDMERLVQEVLVNTQYLINKKQLTVTMGRLPGCLGDRSQVVQVVSNLIENAIKYLGPQRSPMITIGGHTHRDHVVYCIEDNGQGIHPDHQQKIFEVFHRLDPGGRVAGEGLGLSICRRIIDRQGGRIWVESEIGHGSRFFFSLPCPT